MASASRKTIVILEMQPNSPRADDGGFLRICESGYGAELDRAERDLNDAIEASESGKRDLVPLHRLRAKRVYSKATSLQPIEAVLEQVHSLAGIEMSISTGGFFDVSVEEAIRAIEDGLIEYKKQLAAKKKRQAYARKARAKLDARKQALAPSIEAVLNDSAPHSEALRDALDGLDGKQIQTWAEKQLARGTERAIKDLRPRELAVEHAKGIHFDAVTLREIQRAIEALDDGEFVLTDSEESEREELEERADEICDAVRSWRDALPKNLKSFGDIVVETVEDACPLAGSFEDLVRVILIEEWDERDDIDEWLS